MKNLIKTTIFRILLTALLFNVSYCFAENNAVNPSVSNLVLEHETNFGGAYMKMTIEDFNKAGFNFGDSVNVIFSNNRIIEDIPYYNGYYTQVGGILLVGYPGYPYIKIAKNYGNDVFDEFELTESVTATITLNQAKKYLTNQETFSLSYSKNREDYESNEVFANFRALKGGSLKENIFFRSASPCCNDYNRAPYVDRFMQKNLISFVLNLSDNSEEVIEYKKNNDFRTPYFNALNEHDRIAYVDVGANYMSDEYKHSLVRGLRELINHKGPYLTHCIEGKDRTGFVCILIENLCGATVDEMKKDYMITYQNYYGITAENNPDRYNAILELHFNSMYSYIQSLGGAKEYLKSGGMTDSEIVKLMYRLID